MNDLEKLEEILKKIEAYETLGGNVPTTREVSEAIEVVLKVVIELKERVLEKAVEVSKDAVVEGFADEVEKVEVKLKKMHSELTKSHGKEMDSMKLELTAQIERVMDIIPQMPDLLPLENRMDEVEKREVSPEQIREKLSSLKEEERLDKSAIKGIEEIEKEVAEVKARPLGRGTISGGARGIQLYTNGTKRGMAQMVNIIPGTGVSLTYDYANGRNDITINASASTSVLTATGDKNDSNVTFTVASEPAIAVINGASYRSTGGAITWSYDGGTVTLSSPVGNGGDLYFLA